jgi:hypothetical protein
VSTKSRTTTVKTGLGCCKKCLASVNGVSAAEMPKIRLTIHIGVTVPSSNEFAGAFIEEGETGP